MRRRSNSNQTTCSKSQDADITRCEQCGRRPTISSRDEETCLILPPSGDCDRTEKYVDTNDEYSDMAVVSSYEVNGNSAEKSKQQCIAQQPRQWCKNLHYSSSSVSQSDGSGLVTQSSRRSRYRSKCTNTENTDSRFGRSILSTRRKSFLRREHPISYKYGRKR